MQKFKELSNETSGALMPDNYYDSIARIGKKHISCEEVKQWEYGGLMGIISDTYDLVVWVTATEKEICEALLSIKQIEGFEKRKDGFYITHSARVTYLEFGKYQQVDFKEETLKLSRYKERYFDVSLKEEIILEVFEQKKKIAFPAKSLSIPEFLDLDLLAQQKYVDWAKVNLTEFGWFRKFWVFASGRSPVFDLEICKDVELLEELVNTAKLLRKLVPNDFKESCLLNQLSLNFELVKNSNE